MSCINLIGKDETKRKLIFDHLNDLDLKLQKI